MSARFPTTRLRRLRHNTIIRDIVREHEISINDVVLPLFVKDGANLRHPIASMPGHFQLSIDQLDSEIKEITALGIKAVILFGIPATKDASGSSSWQDDGIVQRAIQKIKSLNADLLVIADVCFCEFTDHGHCGVVTKKGAGFEIDNDATLDHLGKQAVSVVKAGADIVAPSGMMDGMVSAIRHALDSVGFINVPILSYAVKYASALYGPFREAAEGAPQFGDRRSYQMDCADGDRALREAELDLAEGADILMIKPASYYLDIIYRVKQAYSGVPICAYQVSGEYAMIHAAAEKGWIDLNTAMIESLLAIKRSGAGFVITYFAKDIAKSFS